MGRAIKGSFCHWLVMLFPVLLDANGEAAVSHHVLFTVIPYLKIDSEMVHKTDHGMQLLTRNQNNPLGITEAYSISYRNKQGQHCNGSQLI